MMKRLAAFALVLGVMAVAARPAAAQATLPDPTFQQQAAPATTPATSPAATPTPADAGDNVVARFGPTTEGARLLKPAATQQDQRVVHAPAYRRSAPGVALMIVGGALFLGGAIVEGQAGDALMVGGVVVAAIGLYQYLQ